MGPREVAPMAGGVTAQRSALESISGTWRWYHGERKKKERTEVRSFFIVLTYRTYPGGGGGG
ncbi:hypothetical protein C7418_3340 [Cupriavidus plantarum]|nr:hypothetical protein C7418_3340 [Cupriavidus plantarum]